MSDYGLLEEVRSVRRGSVLVEAASIGDSELVVDYAGDFNNDPDDPENSGGILDLNGARLVYTSVAYGELPDDPDTILLAAPLAAGGDVDDSVLVVTGGQLAEDWVAHVTMGEGDQVLVPLSVDQRSQWPLGVYADPVPVIVSDDLLHLEDAPGRTVSSRTSFWNTDSVTAEGPGDLALPLTWEPVDGSMHVRWNGITLPTDAFSIAGQVLTIADPDELFVEDDLFTCAYAYDAAASDLGSNVPDPGNGGLVLAFESTGWKFKQIVLGDATDYSSPSYDASAWTTAAAAFGDGGEMADDSGPPHTTLWQKGTAMWVRRTLSGLSVGADINVTLRVDNDLAVYLDGALVHSSVPNGVQTSAVIDGADVTSASMVLAVRVRDELASLGCYFDMELTQ